MFTIKKEKEKYIQWKFKEKQIKIHTSIEAAYNPHQVRALQTRAIIRYIYLHLNGPYSFVILYV